MLKHIGRTLAIGVTLAALVAPTAFGSPIGTDPEPGGGPRVVQTVPAPLGLA
jgi:hypothetical protein